MKHIIQGSLVTLFVGALGYYLYTRNSPVPEPAAISALEIHSPAPDLPLPVATSTFETGEKVKEIQETLPKEQVEDLQGLLQERNQLTQQYSSLSKEYDEKSKLYSQLVYKNKKEEALAVDTELKRMFSSLERLHSKLNTVEAKLTEDYRKRLYAHYDIKE